MPKGRFRVYQDQQDPSDIHFETLADSGAGPVPQEQLELKEEVERALSVVHAIFPAADGRFHTYYRQLLSLAQAGLVGEYADPTVAKQALVTFKGDVTAREGGRIKNKYMKLLGLRALLVGAPALVAALLWRYIDPQDVVAANALLLWVGCAAGVWLSFGARKTTLTFEDLQIPDEDRLEPIVRLFFAGLLTMIIGLSFSLGAVAISVGAVSTSQVNDDYRVALLIGLLCGFSERILSTKVASLASSFLEFGR